MDTDQLQMEAEITLVGDVDWNMARDCDTQIALQVFDGGVVEFVGKRQLDESGPLFERDVEPFADVPCQVTQFRRPQRAVRVGAQRQAGVRPAAGYLLDVGEERVEGLLRQEGRGCDGHIFADGLHEFGVASGLLLFHLLQQLVVSFHVGIAVRPGGDSRFYIGSFLDELDSYCLSAVLGLLGDNSPGAFCFVNLQFLPIDGRGERVFYKPTVDVSLQHTAQND